MADTEITELRDRIYSLLVNDHIGKNFPWKRIAPHEPKFASFGGEGVCRAHLYGGRDTHVHFYVSKLDNEFVFRAWRGTISNGLWTDNCYSERDILRALHSFLSLVSVMRLNT